MHKIVWAVAKSIVFHFMVIALISLVLIGILALVFGVANAISL